MNTQPIAQDNQYLDFRNCSDSIVNVTVYDRMGFNKDPFDCLSQILWFTRGEDFNMIEVPVDEAAINREDVSSNLPLKQTEGTQMEWTKTNPIQAKEGSRLLQFISEIYKNEFDSGRNGSGILAYSNGGLHFEREIVYNEGLLEEFRVKIVYLNLKAGNFPVVFSGDITTETTYEWELLVENFPLFFYEGKALNGWATPQGLTPITIDYLSATASETTGVRVEDITITDPDLIASSDNFIATLYNSDRLMLDKQVLASGSDFILTTNIVAGETYYVSLSWELSVTNKITAEVITLVATA